MENENIMIFLELIKIKLSKYFFRMEKIEIKIQIKICFGLSFKSTN